MFYLIFLFYNFMILIIIINFWLKMRVIAGTLLLVLIFQLALGSIKCIHKKVTYNIRPTKKTSPLTNPITLTLTPKNLPQTLNQPQP